MAVYAAALWLCGRFVALPHARCVAMHTATKRPCTWPQSGSTPDDAGAPRRHAPAPRSEAPLQSCAGRSQSA